VYQVLARKWRPRNFEEVVGQAHIARTLRNAVAAGRVAHAYIFAGVRGTGKTTVARILAKCLNCESGPTPNPCLECAPCTEIAEGRSMDVLEVDAATRTGVDDIRELQEVVSFAPVRDRYKILIIDEAHMLSKAASNALLKTLEEPPAGVLFILATTELHKILPTILSRCQVFAFRRVPPKEVLSHLRAISESEGIRISDATLERIARAGEGSVRDSLSILEGIVSFCGNEVRDEEALELLGGVPSELVLELVEGMAARDASRMLEVLDRIAEQGVDLIRFWSELLAAVRDLILLRRLPGRRDLLARSPDEAAALASKASALSEEDLVRSFQIVADLEAGLKNSSHPRYLFEAALVRLASLGKVRPIEEILGILLEKDSESAPAAGTGGGPGGSPRGKSAAEGGSPRPAATAGAEASEGGTNGPADLARSLKESLSKRRPMLAAAFDQAASVVLEGGTVVVDFGPAAEALKRILEGPDMRAEIERSASEIAGFPVRLVVAGEVGRSGGQAAPPPPPQPAAGSRRAPHSSAPRPGSEPASSTAIENIAQREPGLRSLLREFGAQVLDVRSFSPAEPGGAIAPLDDSPENSS
jgi:DNA polymerase-3 subunit gamma/tau